MADMMNKLDDMGRCCGRKPIKYTREPHYFCPRCDRAYDLATGEQIPNWAWIKSGLAYRRRAELKTAMDGDPT